MDLPSGSVTALIGPNGTGKSTLLRAIAGLHAHAGSVTIGACTVDRVERRAAIAYMPQDNTATSSLTAIEVVLLGRLRSLGLRVPGTLVEEAEAMLARFGVATLAGRTLDAISGGQRQLVFLAQALFRQPRVLLLDEPTASLDLRHQLLVLEAVSEAAKKDRIVVAVAMHDLSLAAQFADSFILLSGGRVEATGSARDVLVPDRLARVFGVQTEVVVGGDGKPRVVPLRPSPQRPDAPWNGQETAP